MSGIRNSITRHEDENSVANRARQLRGELERKRHQQIAIVIVEGDPDQIVCFDLLDNSKCSIVLGFSKDIVIKTIGILLANGFKGALGIVDDDFDTLSGERGVRQNVVITDTHDLETMILQSPALEKTLLFLLPREKLRFHSDLAREAREKMIELGKPLGYLRWLSELENLGLDFKDIYFPKFIDVRKLILIKEAMIDVVRSNSSHCRLSLAEILTAMENLSNPAHDPWLVCQGHDLIEILVIVLRQKLQAYRPTDLEERKRFEVTVETETDNKALHTSLLKCYSREYFQTTRMYQAIKDWEVANAPYSILP